MVRRHCLLLLALSLSVSLALAQDKGPTLLPVDSIKVETRKPVTFTLKTKEGAAARFALDKVTKDETAIPKLNGLALDEKTGAVAWTPTASQAGSYALTFSARNDKEDKTEQTVNITVTPGPIAEDRGPVGTLLKKWYAEGTAAGNTGDFYDNRDGDHSPLSLKPYPQLDQVIYTEADKQQRLHWAGQRRLLPMVVFGNSSTSASVTTGGSNVRMYYTSPRGMEFLHAEYRGNNLYIYPEHRDHDPGHNGPGEGYGDLYPLNSPYLITSQGSSGSDQPFMRVMPHVLAAFRPDVKKKLIENGLLMPTIQMLLRSSSKHLTKPEEYLTGKAHPTVFEGKWVDPQKLVQAAHDIQADSVPPLVQLKVVEEEQPTAGKDFFDLARDEKLCDTPSVIARIVRGKERDRRLVISAAGSLDVNKKPLTYHWVVLRGDPQQIKITPKNKDGSVAEIVVPYQERYEIKEPVPIGTNRVDIGVFAHNGTHYSPPAFVCLHSLDNEARTYDEQGRPLEIGYDAGTCNVNIRDWLKLFDALDAAGGKLPVDLLQGSFTKEELAALRTAGKDYRDLWTKVEAARKETMRLAEARKKAGAALAEQEALLKTVIKGLMMKDLKQEDAKAVLDKATAERDKAAEAVKAADKELNTARQAEQAALRNANALLDGKRDGLKSSPRSTVEAAFQKWVDDPQFFLNRRKDLETLVGADKAKLARLEAARKRLVAFDIYQEKGDGFALNSVRPGNGAAAARLTAYERSRLGRFHGEILQALLYPEVLGGGYTPNFIDFRLTFVKPWRDVYRYDAKGRPLGWTRYSETGKQDFSPDGLLALERDDAGRVKKARTVQYSGDFKTRQFRQQPGKEILEYEYSGPDDFKGTVKSRSPAE
ncbi:MAG: putative Ig domain-containing protein [Gemmataceae bacterium]